MPARSMESATTSKSDPPSVACSRSRVGISSRQGPHQVAQRLSSTSLPRKSARESRLPLPSMKWTRSEEHTSELQSLMRISYAVFCLKKKNEKTPLKHNRYEHTN